MQRNRISWLICVWLFAMGATISTAQETKLEFLDGDRVVFLGNSFFERALEYGHIETALSLSNASHDISFRNVGWDGDTVFCHSRAGGRRRAVFGDAREGFARMTKHVLSLDPTVIFVAYGFNESFEGQQGIDGFTNGLTTLLRTLNGPNRRFVLLSPLPIQQRFGAELDHVNSESNRGYVSRRNKMLRRYSLAIESVAQSEGHHYVDLFGSLQNLESTSSDNGIHLNESGYRSVADVLLSSLSQPKPKWELDSPQANRLRQAIVKKNTLYFHRWRPRNDAFVYGERKDEQKIAQSEPEKIEPFIAKQELSIRSILKGAN